MRLGILCPGQGGQHAGMFDRFPGFTLPPWISGDPFKNANAQPLVCAAILAWWDILHDHIPAPSVVAGYSVGELAAYGIAGALAPQTVLDLATARAVSMDRACDAPNGLAAVRGLARQTADELCAQFRLEIAIVNGFDRLVIGGLAKDLERFAPLAEAKGAHITHLPITIASHTSLMSPARPAFALALESAEFARPAIPVLSGISAGRIRTAPDAKRALQDQLDHPIQWEKCVQSLMELGCTKLLEVGPGNSLSRMVQDIAPHIPARSVEDFGSVDGVIQWVND